MPDQEELAKQVLGWITFAKRPLTTSELQHALGVELDALELDETNLPDIEDIVSVCLGLVTVDEESNIIRLVHYTTQEYFVRTWRQWFPDAEARMTDICATYLTFKAFEGGSCLSDAEFEDRLHANPLYNYASQNWGHHAREAAAASPTIVNLLESESRVEALTQALIVRKLYPGDAGYSLRFPRQMVGLHLAGYFGIREATVYLVSSNNRPDPRNTWCWTPLGYASEMGHEAIVKLLLATGQVDIDKKNSFNRTPLRYAAARGHGAIVKLLLETGQVNINSKDCFNRTPLSYAAARGHGAIVKLLLETGQVDIDTGDYYNQTPLSYASKEGHGEIVKLLQNKLRYYGV